MKQLAIIATLVAASALQVQSANAQQQQQPKPPEIWVTKPSQSGGTVITPGTGQPVQQTQQGNTTTLNYDQPVAPGSVIKVVPDKKK